MYTMIKHIVMIMTFPGGDPFGFIGLDSWVKVTSSYMYVFFFSLKPLSNWLLWKFLLWVISLYICLVIFVDLRQAILCTVYWLCNFWQYWSWLHIVTIILLYNTWRQQLMPWQQLMPCRNIIVYYDLFVYKNFRALCAVHGTCTYIM